MAGVEDVAGHVAPGPAGDGLGEVVDFGVGEGASGEVVGDDGFVVLPGVGQDVGFPGAWWAVPVGADGAVGPLPREVEEGDVAAQAEALSTLRGLLVPGSAPRSSSAAQHHAALAGGRDGHVAVDQEGETAEHLLLGDAWLVGQQGADPGGDGFVVGHG